ncbi:hypothetical protein Tco_1163680 [Tanacetum coccineum]
MADSHISNHPEDVLRHSKLFKDLMVQLGRGSHSSLKGRPCLKTSWKYSPKRHVIYYRGQGMDFRSFMVQGIDGEFNFLPEGGLDENQDSLSTKSMNNKTSNELPSIGPFVSPYLEEGDKSKAVGKRKILLMLLEGVHVEGLGRFLPRRVRLMLIPLLLLMLIVILISMFPFARELKYATDCHWVVAHVTPPSWKQYLRDIGIEQLCDIHDRAYMHQAVLDTMLNSRTQELISTLHKARASCDVIREREFKRDKAYAKLEKKCNEAL